MEYISSMYIDIQKYFLSVTCDFSGNSSITKGANYSLIARYACQAKDLIHMNHCCLKIGIYILNIHLDFLVVIALIDNIDYLHIKKIYVLEYI